MNGYDHRPRTHGKPLMGLPSPSSVRCVTMGQGHVEASVRVLFARRYLRIDATGYPILGTEDHRSPLGRLLHDCALDHQRRRPWHTLCSSS